MTLQFRVAMAFTILLAAATAQAGEQVFPPVNEEGCRGDDTYLTWDKGTPGGVRCKAPDIQSGGSLLYTKSTDPIVGVNEWNETLEQGLKTYNYKYEADRADHRGACTVAGNMTNAEHHAIADKPLCQRLLCTGKFGARPVMTNALGGCQRGEERSMICRERYGEVARMNAFSCLYTMDARGEGRTIVPSGGGSLGGGGAAYDGASGGAGISGTFSGEDDTYLMLPP